MEFIILVGSLVASLTVSGWATALLWSWFVVPTFSLSPITIVQAIGLSIIFKALHGFDMSGKSEGIGEIIMLTFKQVFMYVFVIIIAWIVRLWM